MVDVSHYRGDLIDRASELRRDDEWIAARLRDPATRLVPVHRGRSLLRGRNAAFLAPGDVDGFPDDPLMEPIFLGIDETGPLFAVDMSHLDEGVLANPGEDCVLEELYGIATQLFRRDASLLSHAAWLVRWRRHHRYCGVCGHVTESREAGHVRVCTNDTCRTLAFPRTDPAVIMVTEFADRCLLARQKNWPGGLHSCLAGFVEPGESAEEAVVREVREESGLEVRDVRYHATQPWPYPSSLMLGYFAVATHDDVVIDTDELAAARWFTREELVSLPAGVELPRRDSIARALIDAWIASG
ncbi:MAG: NAD(+) diphosphatase [bacterium]|nr:NAD(+) diphosphatase [bacterium]